MITMRSKRQQEIVLDFTSLLDVTLLILFFFIMFSNFQNDSQRKEADEARYNAAILTSEAENKIKQVEEQLKNVEKERDELSSELENIKEKVTANESDEVALDKFGTGNTIKILYYKDDDRKWRIEFMQGDQTVSTVYSYNYNSNDLLKILDEFDKDSVIFCECIITSSEQYYNRAEYAINRMIETAQVDYPKLRVSYTKIH